MTDARRTTAERRDSGPARSSDAAPGLVQVWLLGRFEVRVWSLTIGEDGWRLRKAASQRQHEHLGVRPVLRPRHRSGERREGELPGGDLADPEPALRLRRDAFGGTLSFATAKGTTSRLSFTGSSLAWVAPKSKARGTAAVYLDGVKVATVDLFSSKTLARQVVFAADGLAPTVGHTLTVRSLGTARRPRVDVVAFVAVR